MAIAVQMCRICEVEKPTNEFYYRNDSDKYRSECKSCFSRIGTVRYQLKEKHERRPRLLREKYGMTIEDYGALLEAQGYGCAICGTDEPGGKWNTHFAVDHNHKSGKIRGLLCGHCNVMLGNAKDNPAVLMAAARYLTERGID